MIAIGLKISLTRIEIISSGMDGRSFAARITAIIATVLLLFFHTFHVKLELIVFET